MLKSYDEMRKIDVTPFVEPRAGYNYLNWAKCIELLHENGAEKVYFEPIPDEKTGSSLRMTEKEFADKNGTTNRCYETRIKVVIDDNEYIFQSPVMYGTNPVKDNSMNQNRVWTSMCRAFVKCVAIHTGLGFSLWLKEETATGKFENDVPVVDRPADEAQIRCLKHYAEEFHLNLDKWLEMNNTSWDKLTERNAAQMLLTLSAKYGEQTPKEQEKTSKAKK